MNLRTITFLILPLLLTGCAGNGYISSTIHTVLGLDVSENPKTQVPHVRFGYIRSGLYYVPTGKSPGPDGTGAGQSVKETPELVSEVFVNAKFLDSVTINEKFAIGEKAVASGAAERAFASTAAQQVAQTSRNVGTNTIEHVDGPATKETVYNTIKTVEKAPSEPSLDAEKVKDQLQGRLEMAGTVTAEQWGKMVPGKTSLGQVMDHATSLANESATAGDPAQRSRALKQLSDLNEKSKEPPAKW